MTVISLLKIFLIIACAFIIGLPLNALWKLLLFVISAWLIIQESLTRDGKRWFFALTLGASVVVGKWLLPQANIQEGHNLFLNTASRSIFEQSLPAPVFKVFKDEFERAYPSRQRCDKNQYGCWQAFGAPRNLYAFSADGIGQSPRYSRVVQSIDFSNFQALRLGTINDIQYNYYNNISDIKRATSPFFLRYEFPTSIQGGALCWKGNVLWENTDGSYEHIPHMTMACRSLTPPPRHLYAYRINPHSDLAMRLKLPWTLELSNFFKIVFSALGCLVIVGLLLQIRLSAAFYINASLLASLGLLIYLIKPEALTGFVIHSGGSDSLTHEGFGRLIAQHLLKGEWALALQGEEPIYYYMPGLRYFRALEKIVFGETTYGYVCILFCLPFIIARFLRLFLTQRNAYILLIFFMVIPIFHSLGFAAYDYVREALKKGYAEPLGYGAFILGFTYILERLNDNQRYALRHSFWGHFALAVAIAMRPNLALPSLVFLILAHMRRLLQKRWEDIFLAPLGITPIFLIPFHNWWFGHAFVPLTSAAFIPANLVVSPATYIRAVGEIIVGLWKGPNVELVVSHLLKWIPLSQSFRLIPLIATLYAIFKRKADISLRICACVAFTMQIQLLFYAPGGRYSLLAWMLCFVVFVTLVERFSFQRKTSERKQHDESPHR